MKTLTTGLLMFLLVSACGIPPDTQGPLAPPDDVKGIEKASFARDLPEHDLSAIPIGGVHAESLKDVLTSGLPLILPGRVPGSREWTLDSNRVFVSKDAHGDVVSYGYFLTSDSNGEPQEVAVEVGSAVATESDVVRPADYAPRAAEAGVLAGRPAHRVDAMESISLVMEASDYSLTLEVFRQCQDEDRWKVGDGICLSWGDIRLLITSMGVISG